MKYTSEIIDADWNERSIDAFQKRPWLKWNVFGWKSNFYFWERERERERDQNMRNRGKENDRDHIIT